MITLRKALPLFMLLFATARVCLADWLVEDVSVERAKELGATLRIQTDGDAGIKVTLDFRAEGSLKDFNRVELRVEAEGKSLLSAPLQVTRRADRASVHFSAASSELPNSSLTVFVPGGLGGEAYRFKLKDFVDLKKDP
jgi:hypothetical protein